MPSNIGFCYNRRTDELCSMMMVMMKKVEVCRMKIKKKILEEKANINLQQNRRELELKYLPQKI